MTGEDGEEYVARNASFWKWLFAGDFRVCRGNDNRFCTMLCLASHSSHTLMLPTQQALVTFFNERIYVVGGFRL